MSDIEAKKAETASKTVSLWQVLVYAFIALSIINSAIDVLTNLWVSDILGVIELQTSPEQQAENNARIGEIIIRIDCSNRLALEEFAEQQGVTVDLVAEQCPQGAFGGN